MSFRKQLKDLQEKSACFYLVYFEDEHCVSIVASKAVIASRIDQIKVGDKVHIKERGKVYNGTIASYGTKKDLQLLENKFIAGEYTPEFLVDAESLYNEDSPLPKKQKLSNTKGKENINSKRKKVKNPNPKKKSNKKEKTRLKEQQSTVTILRVSNPPLPVYQHSSNQPLQPSNQPLPVVQHSSNQHLHPSNPPLQLPNEPHQSVLDQTIDSNQPLQPSNQPLQPSNQPLPVVQHSSNQHPHPSNPPLQLPNEPHQSVLDQTIDSNQPLQPSNQPLPVVQHSSNQPLHPSNQPLQPSNQPLPVVQHSSNQHLHPSNQPLPAVQLPNEPHQSVLDQTIDKYLDLEEDPDPLPEPLNFLPTAPFNTHEQFQHTDSYLEADLLKAQDEIYFLQRKVESLERGYCNVLNRLASLEKSRLPVTPQNSSTFTSIVPPVTPQNSSTFTSIAPPVTPQNSSTCTSIAPPVTPVNDVLIDPEKVLQKYHRMTPLSKTGSLACKLAREAYFGAAVMRRSTVYGCQDKPPLPKDKLEKLKKTLFSLHPEFRSSPQEFEPIWKTATDAINHACSSLRMKAVGRQPIVNIV